MRLERIVGSLCLIEVRNFGSLAWARMVQRYGEKLTQQRFILEIKPTACANGLDVRGGEGKEFRIMPRFWVKYLHA